ncbi:MAG TPA: hypothetical protein VGH37_05540 [Candidatus Acidoferrum sp.]
MNYEQAGAIIRELRAPQIILSNFTGINTCTLSQYLRGLVNLSDDQRDELSFVVQALREIDDESSVPINWKLGMELRPQVEAKVHSYRRARTAELRCCYESSLPASTLRKLASM